MSLYYAYKKTNSVSLADDSESDRRGYILYRDEDMKMGLVNPITNPLISHDAAFEITANSWEEAKAKLIERAENNEMFI